MHTYYSSGLLASYMTFLGVLLFFLRQWWAVIDIAESNSEVARLSLAVVVNPIETRAQ